MVRQMYKEHPLVLERGVLGFQGYNSEKLFCVFANGDNNFTEYGIVENTLLIVDPDQPFEDGQINVFRTDKKVKGSKQLKLSLADLDYPYVGRVILSASHYC